MEILKSIELLRDVRDQVENLDFNDFHTLKRVRDRLTMLIKKIFGENSSYIYKQEKILFSPLMAQYGSSDDLFRKSFDGGKNSLLSLLDTMLEDLQLSSFDNKIVSNNSVKSLIKNDHIFVVHGHNEEIKQSVARMIEKILLKPIILHEQANRGRTIIEKFSDHSNVSFAVVLLTADDLGYSKRDAPEKAKFRARQNVILELGFFIGKLGRENVVAIFETNDNFEIPSDYEGVIFIPYDRNGKWKFDLLKELKAANFNIDANKLV